MDNSKFRTTRTIVKSSMHSDRHQECISWETLVSRSNSFNDNVSKFPTTDNLITEIIKDDLSKMHKIVEHAKGTRVLVHSSVIPLIEKFLNLKRKYGSKVEKELYGDITWEQFVSRLISQRPLVFFTAQDLSVLRNKTSPPGKLWLLVGKDNQSEELKLQDYLSYDEMSISALLGVSSPTFFINQGSRDNGGVKQGNYESEGIIVGLVGARLEKSDVMEYAYCTTSKGSSEEYGFGFNAHADLERTKLLRLWANFYGEETNKEGIPCFPTLDEVKEYIKKNPNQTKFERISGNFYFNISVYKKRIRCTIETFLFEANLRAQSQATKDKKVVAYCHVVGLGLGVWELSPNQGIYMVQEFASVLGSNEFPYISDINFSWFPVECNQWMHKFAHPKDNNSKVKESFNLVTKKNNIRITFSKRNPAEPLSHENTEKVKKLLVAMYAWDSNSFPGNEYWVGKLNSSGDPAAACSSTIVEIQNTMINNFQDKIQVCKF